ncbi:Hsp70 family protein [Alphaproteobacteria bacterium]|nr:Hsp70 family protein [Alphaproteobacteria bacterium]
MSHAEESGACGFDFGTSNSALGYAAANSVKLVEFADGKLTAPTAVFFDDDEKHSFIGEEAKERYIAGDNGRYLRALKSLLGTSLFDEKTVVMGKKVPFTSIVSGFVERLKKTAETQAKAHLDKVVVGRPVFFFENNPEKDQKAENSLRECFMTAGFKSVEFQYEPLAAAFDFERSLQKEALALIVDIGGGTSDFSIVRLGPGRTARDRQEDILANNGVRVGGTNFDRELSLNHAMPLFGYKSTMRKFMQQESLEVPKWPFLDLATWQKISFLYTPNTMRTLTNLLRQSNQPELIERFVSVLENRSGHELAFAIENLKIAANLSPRGIQEANLSFIEAGLSVGLSHNEIENDLVGFSKTLEQAMNETLKLSGVNRETIDVAVLIGGSAQMSFVKSSVQSLFPQAEMVAGNFFEAVAYGLSIDAQLRFR